MTDSPTDDETEAGQDLYVDADGVPLNDLYHTDGVVRTDLKDGIYIGMPEYVYFAQDRLGSSDFKVLASDKPEDWYYGSRHNEFREEAVDKADMVVGRALHAYILEGEKIFRAKYEERPATYPDPKFPDDPKKAKKWNANATYCKDWVKAKERDGITVMDAKDFRNVYRMGELIQAHPELGPYLSGGLSEVTVLFTQSGLPVRVRFDKLLMKFIIDLKSQGKHKDSGASPQYLGDLGVTRDEHTVLMIIRNMFYYLQRFLYSIGRQEMRGMIRDGRIHGASKGQIEWLKKLAEVETWDFVFLFYRKTSNNSRNPAAPIVTPVISTAGDLIDVRGHQKFELGVEQYGQMVERFGFKVPWARVNPARAMPEAVLMGIMGPGHDSKEKYEHDVDETLWDDDDDDQDPAAAS